MKKFENYNIALKNLEEIFDYNEPYGNVVLTGWECLRGRQDLPDRF